MPVKKRKEFREKQINSIMEKNRLSRRDDIKFRSFDDYMDIFSYFFGDKADYECSRSIHLPNIEKWKMMLDKYPKTFDVMLNWYRSFLGREMRMDPSHGRHERYKKHLAEVVALRYSQK